MTAFCNGIVGIGASAGGLQALRQFLANAPQGSGLAYIVVQHLVPTQETVLAELLQQVTPMPVRQAVDRQPIVGDCVYVIPPNAELRVLGGRLHLHAPPLPPGQRLPIDALFVSLAHELGPRAAAVVLSGMGSDGCLGLRAVKAAGGLTAAQEPGSAQFDGMPCSAIASDAVRLVAPATELPALILAHLTRPPLPQDELPEIFALLRQHTLRDFSLYKPTTMRRRIERRMAIHGMDSLAAYVQLLRQSGQEIELLLKELLIGVTRFFRDPFVWEQLAKQVLPELLARRDAEQPLRAWVAGCSTGEEAYSLAIVLAELLEAMPGKRACRVQIFASDLNSHAITSARRGQFPASIAADVSPERLARFFIVQQDGSYCISPAIRDSVVFAHHDVSLDPPFTRIDLLSCRNLLIYFNADLQRRLLPVFHYSLRPGGLLLLGSSESIGRFTRLFQPIDAKLRLFMRPPEGKPGGAGPLRKQFAPLAKMRKETPVPHPSPSPAKPTDVAAATDAGHGLQAAADHVLLQQHAPPAVLINGAGDIVYISGRTGKYLEPAAGKANWNFHAMVRESLRAPLAEALQGLGPRSEVQHLRGLPLQGPTGPMLVDVTVQALHEPAALRGLVMIVFRDVQARMAGRGRTQSAATALLAAELQQCRDEIQALREESQATHEELQAANEELTTSKEEMQSANEELQTVNAEMQSKLDALALVQSDLLNLLNSTQIAMLFLDHDLNVRRFTDRATRIINLRDSDIGRPLGDLTTALDYPGLQDDVSTALRTLQFAEKQIRSKDGRLFSVRIMPYRRLDNVVDGAVITFVDISATKGGAEARP